MQRIPFGQSVIDPRLTSNFLDSCAFDPKYAPEDDAAKQILTLGRDRQVNLVLTHSNHKEIKHPNTPTDIKREAAAMLHTIRVLLTPDELARKWRIHTILTGNGRPEKYAADAAHVFEAGKYVGYFITTDKRILTKRKQLLELSAATIFMPSEWLRAFQETTVA